MEPWSGCVWLQIMFTPSEIVFLPDQGDRQGRGLHRQGRECLLDVIFSGSTTLQGFFYFYAPLLPGEFGPSFRARNNNTSYNQVNQCS